MYGQTSYTHNKLGQMGVPDSTIPLIYQNIPPIRGRVQNDWKPLSKPTMVMNMCKQCGVTTEVPLHQTHDVVFCSRFCEVQYEDQRERMVQCKDCKSATKNEIGICFWCHNSRLQAYQKSPVWHKPQFMDDWPTAPSFDDVTRACEKGWCPLQEKDGSLSVIYASEFIKV